MDMNSIMQQAQQFQQNMARIQEELGQKKVIGTAGGGMVTVTANGKSEILSVVIERSIIVESEADMLQDLVVAATNDALRKAREMGKAEMGKLTGGFNLPGLSNMFG
ncbi:MAG: YbaB/EbfC family nucleoid-associated protein [Proteobacteria bacterium]|jgi:DNA-binding YbaB/EbfC family protein|nr:YbaB/EbfC family nucleoid-associated protein [Desulfocapsa sp.]MBU3945011.1 YbaB/EbfC family nucleoid-associated protein [Pseudomonadota bacterium]MCG2743837.1 YbaB/EbfC family nucleoid-associated protein [Desulfobacteraceae bacterium]MDO8946163.1 YbaB/EbfC family nucleoid-associated protein [Desulfocapsaceae bacterium]MBU3982658.1 YbaB/EbfC family nucleoid-associated protein [Pseudomonadota bacterium]